MEIKLSLQEFYISFNLESIAVLNKMTPAKWGG
jgi:hypothetical protein